jgi:carboxymethylenebutenolidase
MALNIKETEKILRGATDTLLSNPLCSSKTVGIVGFCMGGQLALYAAATNPEKISACVDYYGVHPTVHPPFQSLEAPILGFFAELDTYVSPEIVKALDEKLNRLGKQHEFHTYKGTHHAFFNDTDTSKYDEGASQKTWSRMLEFFLLYVK